MIRYVWFAIAFPFHQLVLTALDSNHSSYFLISCLSMKGEVLDMKTISRIGKVNLIMPATTIQL